jgi:hypothetical protein
MGSHTRAIRRAQQDTDHLLALRRRGLDGLAGSNSLTLPRMTPKGAGKISHVPMGSHTRAIRRAQQDFDHIFALRRGDWTVLQALIR